MWQAMAAQAAKDTVGGILDASKLYISQLNDATASEQDALVTWQQNAATNKSIAETNLQNTIRTGYRIGMLNVQAGQQRKHAAESGFGLHRSKIKVLGAVTANAAAAGQIGASVDAVASDIEMQAENAQASLAEDHRIEELNIQHEFHDIVESGQDALQSAQNISVRRTLKPTKTKWQHIALGAGANAAANYATQRMSLGLGDKQGSTTGGTATKE